MDVGAKNGEKLSQIRCCLISLSALLGCLFGGGLGSPVIGCVGCSDILAAIGPRVT